MLVKILSWSVSLFISAVIVVVVVVGSVNWLVPAVHRVEAASADSGWLEDCPEWAQMGENVLHRCVDYEYDTVCYGYPGGMLFCLNKD